MQRAQGCHPVPREGEGRAGHERVRSGFHHLGVGGPGLPGPCTFLPPSRCLGSWEEVSWAGGRGRPGGRVRPTPPSHRGPGPGKGPAPWAAGMRAGGQRACRIQVTGGRSPGRWGSQPQVSLNRPQTRSRGGQGTGWRLRRGVSPAVSQPLNLLCSPGDIPPRCQGQAAWGRDGPTAPAPIRMVGWLLPSNALVGGSANPRSCWAGLQKEQSGEATA